MTKKAAREQQGQTYPYKERHGTCPHRIEGRAIVVAEAGDSQENKQRTKRFNDDHLDRIGHEVPHYSLLFKEVYPAGITRRQEQCAGCQEQCLYKPQGKAYPED
jgi:hypothetical protein